HPELARGCTWWGADFAPAPATEPFVTTDSSGGATSGVPETALRSARSGGSRNARDTGPYPTTWSAGARAADWVRVRPSAAVPAVLRNRGPAAVATARMSAPPATAASTPG